MNVERMTQRVQKALNGAYTRALSEHNTQTAPEHLLAAILEQTDGVAAPILQKAGIDPHAAEQQLARAIGALPRYSGANADQNQVTVAPALSRLLATAERARQLEARFGPLPDLETVDAQLIARALPPVNGEFPVPRALTIVRARLRSPSWTT